MTTAHPDATISRIAAAIGEPARVRILYSLIDGHARTSTELAVVAEVSPSTASAHLNRLTAERLIQVFQQGRHRYYSLAGPDVARALEALNVIAGRAPAAPAVPNHLVFARTCYDHMAGKLGVALHDGLKANGWLRAHRRAGERGYDVTPAGAHAFHSLGIDVEKLRNGSRRKFAYACLDWSERQPHVAGSLGAALLTLALQKTWVAQDLDSRALSLTRLGERELRSRLRLDVPTA
jgi:DNA-binding transcriptional ArsR family regulator